MTDDNEPEGSFLVPDTPEGLINGLIDEILDDEDLLMRSLVEMQRDKPNGRELTDDMIIDFVRRRNDPNFRAFLKGLLANR